MDITKAQRLLVKIQTFLDNAPAQGVSRLERDLVKSYIQQLYDVVMQEEETVQPVQKVTEAPAPKVQKFEPIHIRPVEPVEEPVRKVIPEVPVFKHEVEEIPVPKIEPINPPVIPSIKSEPRPVMEEVRETIATTTFHSSKAFVSGEMVIALQELFDQATAEDSRYGHVPIANIESALGINDRIFTLNDLFGGDKSLFDATCRALDDLRSFSEAKDLLINGPAGRFNWADQGKTKMAEQFIRIVSRRYPKS